MADKQDRALQYSTAVEALYITEHDAIVPLVIHHPRLKYITIEYEHGDRLLLTLTRPDLDTVSAEIAISEVVWGTRQAELAPITSAEDLQEALPKSWRPVFRRHLYLTPQSAAARDDACWTTVYMLSCPHFDDVHTILDQVRETDKVHTVAIELPKTGHKADEQCNAIERLITLGIPNLVLCFGHNPCATAVKAEVQYIVQNIDLIRKFDTFRILAYDMLAYIDEDARESIRVWALQLLKERRKTPSVPGGARKVILVYHLDIKSSITDSSGSRSQNRFARFIRCAATLMYMIGGSAAEYELSLYDKGVWLYAPSLLVDSEVRDCMIGSWQAMLQMAIDDLIEQETGGRAPGWRRLELDERK